jgi:hypothetical protein
LTRAEFIELLDSTDPQQIASALYSIVRFDGDDEWVQLKCLEALNSPYVEVRWAAATSIGDLAFARRAIDFEAAITALEKATHDSTIADPAAFSLSMVRQFLLRK